MRNEEKYRVFFLKFFISVYRFVLRYVKEEELATDIAQEVFMRAYERWDSLKNEENAKSFLYTVARNMALDYLKHKKAEGNYIRTFLNDNEEADQTFLKEVTRQETFRILYAAIEKLPAQSRQVILYALEGNSVQEIGDKMKISVNTVKTLKKNAYSTLRHLLGKEYYIYLCILLGEKVG